MPKHRVHVAEEPVRSRVPLDHVHAHPANPNVMSPERLAQLQARIEASGRYPPLVVRPHPDLVDEYQLLDGHQRSIVLSRLDMQRSKSLCGTAAMMRLSNSWSA